LSNDEFKREAANAAVDRYVESGMVVGLGTGSTATFAVRRIGELVASGKLRNFKGVPTSAKTTALANELGIPLATLSEARPLLTIDGTDEVSADLVLIKGRGGALLREKIVASSSEEGLIVVADSTKRVDTLGAGPLPVEIDTFGWEVTLEALASLGCAPKLRMDWTDPDRPFVTDGGHYTADCRFDSIPDPASLEIRIKKIPGALECGKNGTDTIEA
jgi:ribose 5-phosphate isomerase A